MGCKKRKTSENDMHLQKCLTFGGAYQKRSFFLFGLSKSTVTAGFRGVLY